MVTERCSSCILPASLPGINLDETGKCQYCRSFEQRYVSASKELNKDLQLKFERILDRFSGKGLYDCLVPVSGGKDSMWVLYVLSRVYKLNVLAFNLDNGFQSPTAARNIERAVKILNVELITYKPREDVMFDLFRTFLIQAGEFCTPCNMLIGAASIRFAKQHNLRLIVTGGSDRWSSGLDGVSISKYADRRYYLSVVRGHIDADKAEHYVTESPLVNAFRRHIVGTAPEWISGLEYLNPEMRKVQDTLGEELGWESPSDELEHGDCLLNPIKDYILNRRWGCSELTGAYSALVRNNEMTREEALRRAEAEEVREPPAVLNMFLEKIGLTIGDFDGAMKRHFTDFSNYRASILFEVGKKALNTTLELMGRR